MRGPLTYSELSLDVAPTYVVASKNLAVAYATGRPPPPSSEEGFFIEGIELKANRLFGPQPRAETYLCLWECTMPRVTAYLSPVLLTIASTSIASVAYNFSDIENSPTFIFVPKSLPDGVPICIRYCASLLNIHSHILQAERR